MRALEVFSPSPARLYETRALTRLLNQTKRLHTTRWRAIRCLSAAAVSGVEASSSIPWTRYTIITQEQATCPTSYPADRTSSRSSRSSCRPSSRVKLRSLKGKLQLCIVSSGISWSLRAFMGHPSFLLFFIASYLAWDFVFFTRAHEHGASLHMELAVYWRIHDSLCGTLSDTRRDCIIRPCQQSIESLE